MFGNPFYYTNQQAFDMTSGSAWGSMNIHMNQAWEDMVARQYLYQVPRYDFSNFNLYTTPTVNVPFGFGIGATPTFGNPFPQICAATLRQLDWQNRASGGNGFINNGTFSYTPSYSWAGFTPSGVTSSNGANGPAAQTEEDRDYQRKYNTLLAIVKQLAKCDEITRKEEDDLNAVARQSVKNWKDGYTELKKAYDKVVEKHEGIIERMLPEAQDLSAFDNTLDSDKKDSFYNQLISAGYEYDNSAIDKKINDLYAAIDNISDENANPESSHILGELQGGNGEANILDVISSYNTQKKGSSKSSDKRIIDHIAAKYNNLKDPDARQTAKEKVLTPIVNALLDKARDVKDTLDTASKKKMTEAISDVENALNNSKDKIDANLSSAFDTLYLLTRMGAIAHVRNEAIKHYGEVDSDVFNQDLFDKETIKDLKEEGFTDSEIKNGKVKVEREAVVEETEDADDVNNADKEKEEEIKPNKKLDKETLDKQIETLITDDILVETTTKYTVTDSEGNEQEYTVYENQKGDKRVFIVKDDKIVELKNAEIKDSKVVAKSTNIAITEVEAKASDIEVAHKEAVKEEEKAEKERKAKEAKEKKEKEAAEAKAKETVDELVDAGILETTTYANADGNVVTAYKETKATNNRNSAREVRIDGSNVQVKENGKWETVTDPKTYFEKEYNTMTEDEIEAAKEIGEEMQDCLAGWTDEDHWEIIKTKLLDVNERNVLYVLKGYNDENWTVDNFFEQVENEYGYENSRIDLMKTMVEHVIKYIEKESENLDSEKKDKANKILTQLQGITIDKDTDGIEIDILITPLFKIFNID